MEYSTLRFGVSVFFLLTIILSMAKYSRYKIAFSKAGRFKLILTGLLVSILVLMFLCGYTGHHESSFCESFVGVVPLLILYYCLHLISKTISGLKKLLEGKKFDEILSLFFLFSYLPAFRAVSGAVIDRNTLHEIHAHESHIFMVTMFLLLDILSSFFEDSKSA